MSRLYLASVVFLEQVLSHVSHSPLVLRDLLVNILYVDMLLISTLGFGGLDGGVEILDINLSTFQLLL